MRIKQSKSVKSSPHVTHYAHDNPDSEDSLCGMVGSDVDRGNGCVALPVRHHTDCSSKNADGKGGNRVVDSAFEAVSIVMPVKHKFPNYLRFDLTTRQP
jgi:hypothetical protein